MTEQQEIIQDETDCTEVALPVDADETTQRQYDLIDFDRAFKMRYHNNHTLQEIATEFGVTRQAVSKRLKRFERMIRDGKEIDIAHRNELTVTRGLRLQVRDAMVDKIDDKKTTAGNLSYIDMNLFNQERLLEGKRTDNFSYHIESEKVADIQREREKLQAERGN